MILRLALRNLARNRRRTLLTVSSIVVSTALLILIHGVMSGMLNDIIASATDQYHGHVVVARSNYHLHQDLFAAFSPNAQDWGRMEAIPGIHGSSQRLRSFGLISHEEASSSVEMLGIRPEFENKVTNFSAGLFAGRYVSESDFNGALIGRSLARRLGVSVGGELIFLSQAADGSLANALLEVRGIFTTLDKSYEDRLVLVNLQWLQEVMVMPGAIHEVSFRLGNPRSASVLARQIQELVGSSLKVLDWGQMVPEIRQVMRAFESSRIVVSVVFYLAAGLGVLNTFFMAVMERSHEIGVLLTIGMRPWKIRGMILAEAFLIGMAGLLLGNMLGLAATFYMMFWGLDMSSHIAAVTYGGGAISPHLKAAFELPNFGWPSLLLMTVCLLAGFLPADRAARLSPVAVLRKK